MLMRQLMISLDKKILDPRSDAAKRMINYGVDHSLHIIIPDAQRQALVLSPAVTAESSGGDNKLAQLWRLYLAGKSWLKASPAEMITTQEPFFLGLAGYWLSRELRVPLEVQLHGDFYGSDYYLRSGLMNLVRWYLGKFVLRRANRVRAAGWRIKKSLSTLGIEENKIIVRPVKIDAEAIKNYQPKFDPYRQFLTAEKIFLALGRLEPIKNISWLVDVFAEAVKNKPNYFLIIVGAGLEHSKLQAKIANLKLEPNVKIEPWTDDPWSYLKSADCLLFPSLSEGYGLVAMEANAAGCPVIMNDVGVANYELKASEKVKILPINDREKWVEAILKI